MEWWAWFVLGFALLIGELFVPTGFYLFIIGISALCMGLLLLLGLPLVAWLQWLGCGLLALILIPLLRQILVGKPNPTEFQTGGDMVGEMVSCTQDVAPGAVGRGELRGAVWDVRNIGASAALAGKRYRVERVDGLTLEIK